MNEQIPSYLQSYNRFKEHRLDYYKKDAPIPIVCVENRVFPSHLLGTSEGWDTFTTRSNALERLIHDPLDFVVVTASKNRGEYLKVGYDALTNQEGGIRWKWLIVDNGSTDGTKDITNALEEDERVVCVPYGEKTGYASPARNFGLDMVHLAYYASPNRPKFVIVIDSDDRLSNPFSLLELMSADRKFNGGQRENALVHGYYESQIIQPNRETVIVPNPRNWGSDHPKVGKLKQFLDKGLNILSGAFPIEFLTWLRYPDEFSFEDDGFNQKLILQAIRNNMTWTAVDCPITTKLFHSESMSNTNNKIGPNSVTGKIGLHEVIGIRAQIVTYLKSLTDYYTQEDL